MSILMTPAYLAATSYPLLNARIGWENMARPATISASTVALDAYLQAPVSDQTWAWWQPTAFPATWTATFTAPQAINYAGIGAHELGTCGATVRVQYDAGGGWLDVPDAVLTPADDGAIMILFADIASCVAMRIAITGTGTCPRIGVIHFGRILEMTRPVVWLGHTPARFNREITKSTNTSERGMRLGTSLIRQGLSGSFAINNLDETWVRATADAWFINSLRYGYFISWRPDQFPAEVYFGWTDAPIVPVNSRGGLTRMMAVSWDMALHSPENSAEWTA